MGFALRESFSMVAAIWAFYVPPIGEQSLDGFVVCTNSKKQKQLTNYFIVKKKWFANYTNEI